MADIFSFFSQHVSGLKRVGNQWRGLCLFHEEKTPSFSVNDDGLWYCFGCGVGGNLSQFMARIGADATFPVVSNKEEGKRKVVSAPTIEYWIARAEQAKSYLIDVMNRPKGMIPVKVGEIDYLKSRWPDDDFIKGENIGLTFAGGKSGSHDVLVFWDLKGAPLFITRRVVPLDKYKNGYGTKPKEALFGSDATGASRLFICEGVSDTLSMRYAGYPAVGIVGATMPTKAHIQSILASGTKEVVFVPDNDCAGKSFLELIRKLFRQHAPTIGLAWLDVSHKKDISEWTNGLSRGEANDVVGKLIKRGIKEIRLEERALRSVPGGDQIKNVLAGLDHIPPGQAVDRLKRTCGKWFVGRRPIEEAIAMLAPYFKKAGMRDDEIAAIVGRTYERYSTVKAVRDKRINVQWDTDFSAGIDATFDVLLAKNENCLFLSNDMLVTVNMRRKKTSIVPMSKDDFRELAGKHIEVMYKKSDGEMRPMPYPADWASMAVSIGRNFKTAPPELDGLTAIPIIRKDGSIFSEIGYDKKTNIYRWKCAFENKPWDFIKAPSHQDAKNAANEIMDLFCDFPFAECTAPSVLLAILTPIGRHMLTENIAPLFSFSAPKSGTGKSLLSQAVALISTGQAPFIQTLWKYPEEGVKVMVGILSAKKPFVIFDNISGGRFGDETIESVITSEKWSGRILGQNKSPLFDTTTTFAMTGNNPIFSRGMERRVIKIPLVYDGLNPEKRTDFKYDKLLHHIRQNWQQIVTHTLTILQAFLIRDNDFSIKGWSSFASWMEIIAGSVQWTTGFDVMKHIENSEEIDETQCYRTAFILEFHKAFANERPHGITIKDIIEKLPQNPELNAAMLDLVNPKNELLSKQNIAIAFRKIKNEKALSPNNQIITFNRTVKDRDTTLWRTTAK